MKKQSRSWLAGILMLALVLALGSFSAYGKGLEGEAYAHPIRHKVFSGAVALDDRLDQVLRDILVVRQQLFCILRQTITTVAEAGIVIM